MKTITLEEQKNRYLRIMYNVLTDMLQDDNNTRIKEVLNDFDLHIGNVYRLLNEIEKE